MFRQTSGVFMGTSPAPELANNFGFWHEFEFLSHMVNEYLVLRINNGDLVDTHSNLLINLLLGLNGTLMIFSLFL